MDEVFADKQVQHLGVATDMPTPDRGTLQVIRQPVSLSRTPSKVVMHTPERGEHTDEVLAEFGFSKDEIEALKNSGAV
jgi:crotonobetainyl-CoA:carnitine CoA-transferase CaiB-like acyl-CoA transferase